MKDASQYPVTFPYGATSAPYGTAAMPYHRGDDRAMPNGTPVIVNGVQIGLSNNTGLSTGSHLHLGRFQGGRDTNPKGQGFNLKNPVTVTTVGSDAINGNYVRLTDGDGIQWVYLHLQSQSVKQGQALSPQEGDDEMTQAQYDGIINAITTSTKQLADFIGEDRAEQKKYFDAITSQITVATSQLAQFIGDARKEIAENK